MHGYVYESIWSMGGTMVGWLLLTLLAVGVMVWLVFTRSVPVGATDDSASSRRIVTGRCARGELEATEYKQRVETWP